MVRLDQALCTRWGVEVEETVEDEENKTTISSWLPSTAPQLQNGTARHLQHQPQIASLGLYITE